MNVLFLSPGFPTEMTDFVRGLAEVGANVIGLGDQAEHAVPVKARDSRFGIPPGELRETGFGPRGGPCDRPSRAASTGSNRSGSR